jgi:transposase
MLNQRDIFEIHDLARKKYSKRRIAEILRHDRDTVAKYLADPTPVRKKCIRQSMLDLYREEIRSLLDRDPDASAAVIRQRIAEKGYRGGISILRDFLRTVRPKSRRAFIRFESVPGEQCQTDWGHFGTMTYGNTSRKLYCFAITECHSRMLYIEFTHAQNQATLHRCLINAFRFFGGTTRELVHDNMLTAVIERDGPLIRYNEAFLAFLRPLAVTPRACNRASPQEKGKIEKGVIHYVRHNFWPLRTFKDLDDLQNQANHWRDTVANVRLHATTGERPCDRFQSAALTPLPEGQFDCRELSTVKVYVDFSVRFDGNSYTVPPWAVGKAVTVKADNHTVTVYLKDKAIASHQRSWERKKRIELDCHRDAAMKGLRRQWASAEVAAIASLGPVAREYLEKIAAAQIPLKKDVTKLLTLKDRYGTDALVAALVRALGYNALGAAAIETIIRQLNAPAKKHTPVTLKEERLNRIRLEEPNLTDYDAFVIQKKGARHDANHD